MALFEDRHWTSADGLRLHFRDYPGSAALPPLLCLPGLTRNARDFEGLAPAFAGLSDGGRRVICPDFRGRGESDYARDPASYNPPQYAADLELLLAQEAISRFAVIGTSLGGLVAMLLAAAGPGRIAGAVLNDIGPQIEPAGLARIVDSVGQGRSHESWMHTARALQEAHGAIYPDFDLARWLTHAKRLMALGGNGRIVFDYDMMIAEPIAAAGAPGAPPPPDLWPLWRALAACPALLLRGESSDVLSEATAHRMIGEAPGCRMITVPRVGHAPTLDEPESVSAIRALLARAV
jgi:pimeloyl-ACP methyl ester carboxylesterase